MRRQLKAQTLAPLAGNRGFESAFPPAATICGAAPLRRCAAIRHGAARVRLIRGRPRKFMLFLLLPSWSRLDRTIPESS
jgi:hypothetical protein